MSTPATHAARPDDVNVVRGVPSHETRKRLVRSRSADIIRIKDVPQDMYMFAVTVLVALKYRGWSRSELARRINWKVPVLSRVLNAIRQPKVEHAIAIAGAFGPAGQAHTSEPKNERGWTEKLSTAAAVTIREWRGPK